MRTRSRSCHKIAEPLRIEFPSQEDQFQEDPPEVPMADNRTMAQLLQAPTFFGHDKEDPHAHIRYFNKITSTMRVPNVPNSTIKLMLFPFSLEGAARIWLEKEPPRSILTWDDLVSKFINQFFPPSKTANLRNEITGFQQRFDESFSEAWDCFNDLLRASPHHGFSELHQLDTFYNALNVNDQDSLNSAADKKNHFSAPAPSPTPAPVKAVKPNCVTCGGTHSYQNCPATSGNVYQDNIQEYVSQAAAANYNQENIDFRPQMVANQIRPPEFLPSQLHRPQVNQPLAYKALVYQAPIPQTQSVSQTDFERYIKANDAVLRNIQSQVQSTQNQYQTMQNQFQTMQNQLANLTDMMFKFMSSNIASSLGVGTLPGNTISNPKEDLKGTEVTKDQVQTPSSQSTAPVQPPVAQSETPFSKPVVAPVSAPMPNLKPSIPYPSRRDNERRRDQANEQIEKFYEIFKEMTNEQIEKFYEIFKEMSFEISFTDALILIPKFASTLKALIGNKEKLSEMARTPINEHCSAVILNKLPKKLGDTGKFLIPYEFPGMDECLALADLGASINLMPLSVWKELLLSKLTPTCMTLELADHSVSKPIGIAKDVSVKVGMFHFPADFVVVDFEQDPRVSLILGRCFLKTGRALIDVHKGELTLRIRNESITYNLDQTSRYSANYDQMTANKIDVTDEACEEYSQEVLSFSNVTTSGSPTPSDDLIVSTTSPTLTPFGDSDFLLFEEANAFIGLEDDPDSPEFNPSYYDPDGDILMLEAILNTKTIKSFVDEPHEVELKDLPPHLEYAFLEGDNKLPVIIAKELGDEEKSALIKVLKSHKRAIAWKLSDIQGNEYYCFLDGFSGYFQIPIDPRDQEKTTFTYPYGTFAYRRMPFGLCNAPGTFQRCMLAIFHDMVEKTMEVFMDDFSVFGNSFENCLSRLDKMLQRREDTKLCLNWEKSHFMVKEGIVLGHKISKNRIEVDKAKFDEITKLPHPTTVK
nr:hypothetical protein [Tanacetum cinerariifolium]